MVKATGGSLPVRLSGGGTAPVTGSAVVEIGARPVGVGHPCLIVAEIAQAHDGSLGAAHAYVDAVGRAGADAVKFQTHLASAESTPGEPFRVKFSRQDANRYDYWKRMEFTEEQWRGLADHCREAGLLFLSSPFSFEAADLLQRIGVPAFKVGSGETSNLPLLEHVARSGKPVLLSSGMSSWEELDAAVACVRSGPAPVAVYQCSSAYPCPPERLGLNLLEETRARYGCPIGLSDHSGTPFAGLAAVTLGANLLELHVVFSRECFGPDTPASVTTAELAELVRGVRFIEAALAHPRDREVAARETAELRLIFGKSLVAARDLRAGHRLLREDIALKKPGTGIPASRLGETIGRTLARSVKRDELFQEPDLA
jgi:N-acetylneuraminate synthase